MVQELQYEWEQQMDQDMTDLQQWQQFNIFYCTTIKEFDQVGITTARTNRANRNSTPNRTETAAGPTEPTETAPQIASASR